MLSLGMSPMLSPMLWNVTNAPRLFRFELEIRALAGKNLVDYQNDGSEFIGGHFPAKPT